MYSLARPSLLLESGKLLQNYREAQLVIFHSLTDTLDILAVLWFIAPIKLVKCTAINFQLKRSCDVLACPKVSFFGQRA